MIDSSNLKTNLVFKELYSRYSNHVYKFCRFYLEELSEAEDVFQEVFIHYYNQLMSKNYVPPEKVNVKSYLLKSAKSRCINKMKSSKIQIDIKELNLFSEDYNLLEKKELNQQIKESIELLDDKYKEAFILKEVDGMTFKEIAEHLGLTLSGAQSRVVRAKERLIIILSPYVREI